MKRNIITIIIAIWMLSSASAYAQVAINKDGSDPAAGAILHIKGSGGNHFFVNDADGFVGISITNPSVPLEVVRNVWPDIVKVRADFSNNALIFSSGSNWASISAGPTNRDDIVLRHSSGDIGIGTTLPSGKFHVTTDTDNSGDSCLVMGHNGFVGIGTAYPQTPLNVVASNWQNIGRFSDGSTNALILSSGADYASISGGTTNADHLIIKHDNGNVGIGNTNPDAKLCVEMDGNTRAKIGYNEDYCSYFAHREIEADGDGQAAIFGYRTRSTKNTGTGYDVNSSNTAIKGYNYWGDTLSFGVGGWSYNDYRKTGGVIGAYIWGNYWGSLGYRDSGGNTYGGYFTSTGSGTGKGTNAHIGHGIGAWGDLFGADVHGEVYGIYAEGGEYAMYSNGDVYKNALDIHLQKNDAGENEVLYTNVSTDATVQTAGIVTIQGGKANINFDKAFSSTVSDNSPIIVTATPTGESQGIFVANVSKDGFSITENNGGKSNVTVSYIAIGKRKGYESPVLAQEVVDATYTQILSKGMLDDSKPDKNAKGLYLENNKLTNGVHPSTIIDPSTKEETFDKAKVKKQKSTLPKSLPSLPVESNN
jgi:hypothetical protein